MKVPQALLGSSDPPAALGERLRNFGFRVDKRTENVLRFTRRSALGDFSIKIAKVNLTFAMPLTADTEVLVEYGSFAAFDTGDLWTFTSELKAGLES